MSSPSKPTPLSRASSTPSFKSAASTASPTSAIRRTRHTRTTPLSESLGARPAWFDERNVLLKHVLRKELTVLSFSYPQGFETVNLPCDVDGIPILLNELPEYTASHNWLRSTSCWCLLDNGGVKIPLRIFVPTTGVAKGHVCLGCDNWLPHGRRGCSYFISLNDLLKNRMTPHPTAFYPVMHFEDAPPNQLALTVWRDYQTVAGPSQSTPAPSSDVFGSIMTPRSGGKAPAPNVINKRVLNSSRLHIPPLPPAQGDAPLMTVQDNIDTICRLFNINHGLGFPELMAQLGQCSGCGKYFGVTLLQGADYTLHICPSDSARESSPTFTEIDGVLVQDGISPPGPSRFPLRSQLGITSPGPARPRRRNPIRPYPIYQDAASPPLTQCPLARARRRASKRPRQADIDLTVSD
ncbi:hypothetical protein QCA50_013339 [Cerrena zonata]|uniref:Uncharacterized protein n=1 Tax=Cerrena zonata TaxID=2478898 RepID=A0AAW0FQD4_9APHY